jgi:hypothetical protein
VLAQLDHGAQGLVVALAAVVLQAFAAQLGARLVQLLQAGVQHGLGHQLQVAAAVKSTRARVWLSWSMRSVISATCASMPDSSVLTPWSEAWFK